MRRYVAHPVRLLPSLGKRQIAGEAAPARAPAAAMNFFLGGGKTSDGEREYWRRIRAAGVPPGARESHTATSVGARIYVFGGSDASPPAPCQLLTSSPPAPHQLPPSPQVRRQPRPQRSLHVRRQQRALDPARPHGHRAARARRPLGRRAGRAVTPAHLRRRELVAPLRRRPHTRHRLQPLGEGAEPRTGAAIAVLPCLRDLKGCTPGPRRQ